ncbi:hypothetical protein V9T40_010665 [Parthenolecanium corni]|uniref:Uncharacterized protein n=1 Tax=Parthenolecanium corni TaxID=536013 RepID=A0AAN9T7J2_9HEMI
MKKPEDLREMRKKPDDAEYEEPSGGKFSEPKKGRILLSAEGQKSWQESDEACEVRADAEVQIFGPCVRTVMKSANTNQRFAFPRLASPRLSELE